MILLLAIFVGIVVFLMFILFFFSGSTEGPSPSTQAESDDKKDVSDTPPRRKAEQGYLARLNDLAYGKLIEDIPHAFMVEPDYEKKRGMLRDHICVAVHDEMENQGLSLTKREQDSIVQGLLDDILGFGPIQIFLDDETVSGVMVNGPSHVYYEKAEQLVLSDKTFQDNDHVMRMIERMTAPLGLRINESVPHVISRLPDGSAVHAVIPPLCQNGPSIMIVKFREKLGVRTSSSVVKSRPSYPPEGQKNPILESGAVREMITTGALTEAMALFLDACVKFRLNIVVSGGAGAGKSTTLNLLSNLIPEEERIIVCENTPPLEVRKPHVMKLVTCPARSDGKGAVSLSEILKISRGLRPGRILVGECKGAEVFEMLQAINSGQDGVLTTCYADSPSHTLSRLESMFLIGGANVPANVIRRQIASSVHLIVHQSRLQDGSRKITHISEIQGMNGEEIVVQDLFRFVQSGVDDKGNIIGTHTATGIRPAFATRFEERGIRLPAAVFPLST